MPLTGNVWNLVETARGNPAEEVIDPLVQGSSFELKRIVSFGQWAPEAGWFDQAEAEWVLLVTGSAGLRFEDEESDRHLVPGDSIYIAPRRRHRVTWTEPGAQTIWLALHYNNELLP